MIIYPHRVYRIDMKKTLCPDNITSRLHRIEGQVRAIEKMYNEKRDVEEIIRVAKAARSALDSVSMDLVEDKVNGCYDGKRLVDKKQLLKLTKILFNIS